MKVVENIVYAENYTNKDGEEKTRWHNIGVILEGEKNGKPRKVVKLTCMPLNTDGFFNVFPYDPDRKGKTSVDDAKEALGVPAGADDDDKINLDEIPF